MLREASSPAAYRKMVTGTQSEMLESIRDMIFEVAPKITENVDYGMLDYPGLANLAAQKRYVSLYVLPDVLAEHKKHFSGVNAGKSCLRFTRPEQVVPAKVKKLLKDVLRERRRRAR